MLRFPRVMWVARLAALVLAAPAFVATFYCDDQLFVARLEGLLPAPRPGPLSLYTLATGGAENEGPFWWTSPNLRMSLLRPLASALFAADHAVWGRSALPYHLHSFAWFVAAVLVVSRLQRRLLPEREAALATLIFAVAPVHAMAVNWPAARHVLIAGTFAFGAVLFHLRAREQERPPWAALALLSVGLATSEIALGAFGYVFAYEVTRDGAWREKARALAPYVLLGAAYLVAYRLLGCGVKASGDYVDPLRNPLAFLLRVPAHLGPLVVSALVGIPSEATVAFPALLPPLLVLATLFAVAFYFLARHASPTVRWLLLGAFLATLPGLSGIVGDRVLFVPSLGIAAVMGSALANAWRRARVLAVGFALFQLGVGPLFRLAQGASFAHSSRAAMELVARSDIPRAPGTRVFGIGIADPLMGMYLQPALILAGWPALPVQMLSVSLHDHVLRRTGERTMEIEVVGGSMLENGFETVVRPASEPLRRGDVVRLEGLTVEVLDDVQRKPNRFAVTFERSIDDPAIALVAFTHGALRRLPPLAVGASLPLPHEIGPVGF